LASSFGMGCSMAHVVLRTILSGRYDPRQHHSYMTQAMKTASKKTIVKRRGEGS
jgi:hypothetical protein